LYKKKNFQRPQNRLFPKGLIHAFDQKVQYFLYFFSVKIGLEIKFNNVLDRKETFIFVYKQDFLKSQKSHFSEGINPCFWSTNSVFFFICFRAK